MTAPLGLFITCTVYGTFLPGDVRGWRHRVEGGKYCQPRLERWTRDKLKHDIVLLNQSMRDIAEAALREICHFRSWQLWAVSVRTNHIHVVITAPEYAPETVRDQLKAKATRELRSSFAIWNDRPVWSRKGDIQFLDTEDDIEKCAIYVAEAQDRKSRDHM